MKPIRQHANHNRENFFAMNSTQLSYKGKELPILESYADGIYNAMFDLLLNDTYLNPELMDNKMITVSILGNGAFLSWKDGYVLAATGLLSSSMAILRKSIEFTCYALKVANGKNREYDWIKSSSDIESRKKFFAANIPLSYEKRKYEKVWELLLDYDRFSEYGTHANISSLVFNYKPIVTKKSYKPNYSIYADQKRTYTHCLDSIRIGYRILEALSEAFKPCLRDTKRTFQAIKNLYNKYLTQLFIESGKILNPQELNIENIVKDDKRWIETTFQELIKEYRERQKNKHK